MSGSIKCCKGFKRGITEALESKVRDFYTEEEFSGLTWLGHIYRIVP